MARQGNPLERDIAWLATFEEGTKWYSDFRPNREQQLVKIGALVPTNESGVFLVGRVPDGE